MEAELEHKIDKDVYKAWYLSKGLERSQKYSKVYLNSNENLEELFNQITVRDKEVLTVLSSSDQYFRCLYNGARNVDTYDVSIFPPYYYYVRKWYMEINKQYAINRRTVEKDDEWFHELLPKVKCESIEEEVAYKFWKKYVDVYNGKLGENLFRIVEGDFTFDRAVEPLCEIMKKRPLNYTNYDICEEQKTSKTYDVIILSNILEWYLFEPKKIEKCRDNLKNILKDDGKIICSCLGYDINEKELEIFQDDFTYERIFDQSFLKPQDVIIGYSYQKKKTMSENSKKYWKNKNKVLY